MNKRFYRTGKRIFEAWGTSFVLLSSMAKADDTCELANTLERLHGQHSFYNCLIDFNFSGSHMAGEDSAVGGSMYVYDERSKKEILVHFTDAECARDLTTPRKDTYLLSHASFDRRERFAIELWFDPLGRLLRLSVGGSEDIDEGLRHVRCEGVTPVRRRDDRAR